MKKINEMTTMELSTLLLDIAEPMNNLASDDELFEAFRRCTLQGMKLKQRNGLKFIMQTYGELVSKLLGEKHRMDTLRILAAVEGKPITELMTMNGTEVLADIKKAWEDNLKDFFSQSAPTAQRDASLH